MKTKLTILFLLLATTMMAQELRERSFIIDNLDLTARTNQVLDENNMPCALVKVNAVGSTVRFKSESIVKNLKKNGEYWIYMNDGARQLTITADTLKPLTIKFPVPLRKETTYELGLEISKFADKFVTEHIRKQIKRDETVFIDPYNQFLDTITCQYDVNIHWPIIVGGLSSTELNNLHNILKKELYGDTSEDIYKASESWIQEVSRNFKNHKCEFLKKGIALDYRDDRYLYFTINNNDLTYPITYDSQKHRLLTADDVVTDYNKFLYLEDYLVTEKQLKSDYTHIYIGYNKMVVHFDKLPGYSERPFDYIETKIDDFNEEIIDDDYNVEIIPRGSSKTF